MRVRLTIICKGYIILPLKSSSPRISLLHQSLEFCLVFNSILTFAMLCSPVLNFFLNFSFKSFSSIWILDIHNLCLPFFMCQKMVVHYSIMKQSGGYLILVPWVYSWAFTSSKQMHGVLISTGTYLNYERQIRNIFSLLNLQAHTPKWRKRKKKEEKKTSS